MYVKKVSAVAAHWSSAESRDRQDCGSNRIARIHGNMESQIGLMRRVEPRVRIRIATDGDALTFLYFIQKHPIYTMLANATHKSAMDSWQSGLSHNSRKVA